MNLGWAFMTAPSGGRRSGRGIARSLRRYDPDQVRRDSLTAEDRRPLRSNWKYSNRRRDAGDDEGQDSAAAERSASESAATGSGRSKSAPRERTIASRRPALRSRSTAVSSA